LQTEGAVPPFSSVSSAQKLTSPTFQTPSWYTAVPFWPLSDAPLTPMLYLTAAVPPDFSVTLLTVAVADVDSGEPAWLLMMLAKFDPFCTSAIFIAAGDLPLKNISQLVVIAVVAPLPEVGSGSRDGGCATADGGPAGADACTGADGEPVAPLLLVELLQEVTAAASAKPNAGASKIRRTTSWDRIDAPPWFRKHCGASPRELS
jgi:hypothetical protein